LWHQRVSFTRPMLTLEGVLEELHHLRHPRGLTVTTWDTTRRRSEVVSVLAAPIPPTTLGIVRVVKWGCLIGRSGKRQRKSRRLDPPPRALAVRPPRSSPDMSWTRG
jgi:hypothetical protein